MEDTQQKNPKRVAAGKAAAEKLKIALEAKKKAFIEALSNETMLTEEQIQILAKKLAVNYPLAGLDEVTTAE